MKVITINIPDTVEVNQQDVTMYLATELYKQGKLSIGQAADLAGLSKRAFIELIGKYNTSVFNYSAQEIVNDITHA